MANNDDVEQMRLFGTGGDLLKTLKNMLTELTKLRSLKLIDLNLERYHANHLLDEVIESCGTSIRNLHLINPTLTHCPILHVGLFFNLETLVISPQNLDDDVLQLLANTRLKHFHILQNMYTPTGFKKSACSAKSWKALKDGNPNILVHLRVESLKSAEVLLQPDAPVYSITHQTPKNQVSFILGFYSILPRLI
jgi:F-box protein 39